MRIKTFQASSVQEALSLARRDLGDDAVVLNTRQVKSGGLLGLGGSNKVELMVAVDDEPSDSRATQTISRSSVASTDECTPSQPHTRNVSATTYNMLGAVEEIKADQLDSRQSDEIAQLRLELKHLTSVVYGLLNSKSEMPSIQPDKPLIMRLGVDEAVVREHLPEFVHIEDRNKLSSELAKVLRPLALPPILNTPKVIVLVGPTGVGKTTTLAKLAARFSIEQNKRVALVTADTFRIGAVEQLRTYARIMGVPLEIALSPDEVKIGVEKHSDCDVILIDTVGRSPRHSEHLRELKTFLDPIGSAETYLVIAASLAADVQREVIETFSVFSPCRLVVTKLDEAPNSGCLVNLPFVSGLGIACITAGQNVPQDIEFADASAIARRVTEAA
jgi:flagellar biosynthesis protein FlhF